MQIRRIEHEPHAYAQPHGSASSAAGQTGERTVSSSGSRVEQSSTKADAGSPLSALTGRLNQIQEIRSDVVEAAREKVAQGLFDTRESAERLAATDLRHDYF